jgi:hypothetical protein
MKQVTPVRFLHPTKARGKTAKRKHHKHSSAGPDQKKSDPAKTPKN